MAKQICISKLSDQISGRCSKSSHLKTLEELNEPIPLDKGGTQTVAEILRIQYGQFDGDNHDLMVCDAHEAECIRRVRGVNHQYCEMPEQLSSHPGKRWAASRSIPYKCCKAIYKEYGILMPLGKGMA